MGNLSSEVSFYTVPLFAVLDLERSRTVTTSQHSEKLTVKLYLTLRDAVNHLYTDLVGNIGPQIHRQGKCGVSSFHQVSQLFTALQL